MNETNASRLETSRQFKKEIQDVVSGHGGQSIRWKIGVDPDSRVAPGMLFDSARSI